MTDLFTVHPAITLHLTLVFGISASLPVAGLAFLFRHRRGAQRRPRPSARWRIEYRSRKGVQFHISKTPPEGSGPSQRLYP